MKLLKTTVAAIAILAPLVIGSTSALAQERGRWGGRGGGDAPPAQAQQAPQRQFTPREGGGRGGPQVQGQTNGGRGGFRGERADRGGFRGGYNGGGRQFGGSRQFQGAPQAQAQAPVQQQQQQFRGRGDRGYENRGDQGRNAFRGGDNNRFNGGGYDNRGDNRFRGGNQFQNDNRFRGDNNRFGNDNRYRGGGYNRGGERFSYRGRDFFRFRAAPYSWPRGYAYRSWSPRQILPSLFLSNQYYLNDFYDYGLDEPPYGYQWVRVGEDALLVNLYTGEILDVVPGVFYW